MSLQPCSIIVLALLLLVQSIQGWVPPPPSIIRQQHGRLLSSSSSSSSTSSSSLSLLEKEARLKSQKDNLPPLVVTLLQRIPPSTVYKSDQLKEAHEVMMSLLLLLLVQDNDNDNTTMQPRILHDAISYYMDTLHAACHEILGHVHIQLARDVYTTALKIHEQPEWCRSMYEILQTDLDATDEDLLGVLQDWVELDEEESFVVRDYLRSNDRLDLWEQLKILPTMDETRANKDLTTSTTAAAASLTNNKKVNGISNKATKTTTTTTTTATTATNSVYRKNKKEASRTETLSSSDPHKVFQCAAEKVDDMMAQDRINSTLYYNCVYAAIDALRTIDRDEECNMTEEELRAGLWIAATALLRRDATWIFRHLDQRGFCQRDDVYQLLHVYCNDNSRRPFSIQFALTFLEYCETKSDKNAYIRRPDPIMFRMVLKSIGETAAYGFGHRALQVLTCMAQRAKDHEAMTSSDWKPVFTDIFSAVTAFCDDSTAWASVQRADQLVRSLYKNNNTIGQQRETPPAPLAIQQLEKVGHKLRVITLPSSSQHQSTSTTTTTTVQQGPLYKVLEAYKDEKQTILEAASDNSMRRVEASLSLFEFAVEQTAVGNKTLEELSKYHFLQVIEHCKRTNTFLAQECVRIFQRVDQLVGQGLLSQDLVSPSVSFQILSLLAADKSARRHSLAAVRILDHYQNRTQETRLAAFQYAIQCCCYEDSKAGTQLAVTLIERASRAFRRKPFRDSFFVETLQQIELHCPEMALRVYEVINFKLYANPLDVDSRIAILMSLYRCLRKDDSLADKVDGIVAKLEKLRQQNPQHPAFASGECLQALQIKREEPPPVVESSSSSSSSSRQPTYAIDILLSSKEAGDIVMAESILEQGEDDGTPHDVHTYQRIVEAFIGNNDMSAATHALRRMKNVHSRDACLELETNVFDILLSSAGRHQDDDDSADDDDDDLTLAESMMSWSDYERSDLANMCTKIVYTYLTLSDGQVGAQRVLDQMSTRLDEDFLTKLQEVFVDAAAPNGASSTDS